jgi:hypothetical protein
VPEIGAEQIYLSGGFRIRPLLFLIPTDKEVLGVFITYLAENKFDTFVSLGIFITPCQDN